MSSKRRNLELAMAALFAVAILAAGGLAIFVSVAEPPIHPDPAAIPATTAAAPPERYAGAVEEGRRLARALLTREELVPSLSVAVAKDGELVWAEAFGYAELERHTPATPRTRFRLGSVSKTMTATAVALLHERGKIDLDAPIQTYVPAYPRKQWTVTPRQLLGDVAGVHRIRGDNNDPPPRGQCKSLDQALPIFSTEPLLFEPGTQYKFSTFGWILLSAAVEGAAAAPFPTFMRREVFEPLGMDRTAIEGTDTDMDVVAFRVPSAESTDDEPQDPPAADYGCSYGAGAILSTPSDLVRLGSATTVRLKPDTTRGEFLKAETITLFQTPLTLKSGASTGFALGWKVDSIPLAGAQVRVVRHRANFIGGGASLSVFPDLGLVVAATSSISHIAGTGPFALEVAEAFLRP